MIIIINLKVYLYLKLIDFFCSITENYDLNVLNSKYL